MNIENVEKSKQDAPTDIVTYRVACTRLKRDGDIRTPKSDVIVSLIQKKKQQKKKETKEMQ